ncbi:glucosidase 2 subunit beta [Episyrphus balteatus]|uniref:glucosidase 2 subunit beta n=1 Tax=Episyrphus balteatus TaxID=286459 RepID=UPI00248672C2|nr:glucosidase 2 subunit beta [Episyrphus balteatus]
MLNQQQFDPNSSSITSNKKSNKIIIVQKQKQQQFYLSCDRKMQRSFHFAFIVHLFVLSLSSNLALGTGQIPRPRGVAISKTSLYPPRDEFVCFNGLKTISYLQINDDFCDCPDGSDEPGTSACPEGKFHCTNAGFKPKNIPSSRVNDGICDCCDASDEYGFENSKCINTCLELGKEERQLQKSRQELAKRGITLKAELSSKGKAMRDERDVRLAELQNRRQETEAIREEKQNLKKQAEDIETEALQVYKEIQETEKQEKTKQQATENENEAQLTFLKFDSNKDGFIELAELQTRASFDKDRNGEVSEEEARFFLDEKDRVDQEHFVSICWARIKPYLMLDAGLFKPPQLDGEQHDDEDHYQETDTEPQLIEPSQADDQEEEGEAGYEPEEEDEEGEETGEGAAEEVTQPKPDYDPETQKIIEQANAARNAFDEVERQIREIDQEIKEIQEQANKDYGTSDEFAPLEGQCFSYEDREYVYKLCPFDRASQQPRNGGAETRLGSWDRWSGSEQKYSQMLYSNGASCWNGPQRSAVIKLECGLDHKVTGVSEPNRCEYHMVFETPAACENPNDSADDGMHDEL